MLLDISAESLWVEHQSDMANSRSMQVREAVASRIHDLGLKINSVPVNIIVLKIASDQLPDESEIPVGQMYGETEFPMIQVSPTGRELIEQSHGTDTRYNISYPVQVSFVAQDDGDFFVNDDQYHVVRESIMDAFVSQTLPSVPEIWYTTLAPETIIDTSAFLNRNSFVSAIAFYFHERRESNPVVPDPIPIGGE